MIWNAKFLLGVDTIDAQHKKLIDMIEETNDLIVDAKDGLDCYDDIKNLLDELQDYTVYHFNYEEELFKKVNYIELENHHLQHTQFVKKLYDFVEADIDEDQIGNLEKIMTFLLDWLSNHILITDKKYVDVLKASNVQ
jgi:hemerythrin